MASGQQPAIAACGGSAEGVPHCLAAHACLGVPGVGALLEQFPGGVDRGTECRECEPAADRDTSHAYRCELRDRWPVRPHEYVDRAVDRLYDAADVAQAR